MKSLSEFIDLRTCRWIAGGNYFDVYEAADYPDLLIKVVRPEIFDESGFHKRAAWFRRRRLMGVYGALERELKEFLMYVRRRRGRLDNPPFALPYGFVQTSQGLGFMVERIMDGSGATASTLQDLRFSKIFSDRHRAALHRFFDRCKQEHIALGDIHMSNLVYSDVRATDGEFVCVDGLGEKTLIPIHAMSRFFNDRRLERLRTRMLRKVDKPLREGAQKRKTRSAPAALAPALTVGSAFRDDTNRC